jgi:hypothetical protein
MHDNGFVADHYGVLGVSRKATAAQIKEAYRRNARRLHPDVNPDPWAAERFKEMTHAYEVLGDEKRRAEYDLLPPEPETPQAPSHDDTSFVYILRNVLAAVRREQQVQRYARNPVRSVVYSIAGDILDKSLSDYDAALRNPRFQAKRPVVVAVAERFLQTIDPTADISDERSAEHLRSGVLGMVGLTRVAQVVGRDATPKAKEAAARAVMFALAGALVQAGLIQQRAPSAGPTLTAGTYAARAQSAFVELEEVVRTPAAG